MLITCTNCRTSYQVSATSLGPTGRAVRCARCKQTWFAANTEVTTEAETHNVVDVLVVKGSIVNDLKARRRSAPPALLPALPSGYEVYSWTAPPSRNVLLPGVSSAGASERGERR